MTVCETQDMEESSLDSNVACGTKVRTCNGTSREHREKIKHAGDLCSGHTTNDLDNGREKMNDAGMKTAHNETGQQEDEAVDFEMDFEDEPAHPVDRGWAWMILLGAFINQAIIVGIYRSFGILFTEIQRKYDSTSAVTALISSCLNAVYSVTSIFVSTIGYKFFSQRTCVIAGGICMSLAYVLAGFAETIETFVVLCGCLTGIGQGFIVCSSTVLVGHYFSKRRALANGIMTAGGSIGVIVFSLATRFLLDCYGLSGTLLIMAGVSLHCVVSGCLMRPPSFYDKNRKEKSRTRVTNSLSNQDVSKKTYYETKENATYRNGYLDTTEKTESQLISSPRNGYLETMDKVETQLIPSPLILKKQLLARTVLLNNRRFRTESVRSNRSAWSQTGSIDSAISRDVILQTFATSELSICSIMSLNNVNANENKNNTDSDDENDMEGGCCGKRKCLCKNIIDCRVLKSWTFRVLLLFLCLMFAVVSIPVFLPAFATDKGLPSYQSDKLVTIISSIELFPVIVIGLIADKGFIRRTTLLSLAAISAATGTFCAPLFSSFETFVAFSVWYGLVNRIHFCLYPSIIVDYLGIEHLGSAIGITILMQTGSSSMLYPIIGAFRDRWHSYVPGYLMVASMMAIGGLGVLSLPYVDRLERQRNKGKDTDPEKTSKASK